MKVSNIWRLLKILLIFSRKHKVKAKEIAQELEISLRQAYRGINSLKTFRTCCLMQKSI
ncbi:MAG: HTH domain-containing protein [Candidatus Humimicrobiaceae bacterium]